MRRKNASVAKFLDCSPGSLASAQGLPPNPLHLRFSIPEMGIILFYIVKMK